MRLKLAILLFFLSAASLRAQTNVGQGGGGAASPNTPADKTVATLPGSPATGDKYLVTDGNGYSCTSGGGSTRVLCRWTGAAWEVFNQGSGAAPAFSAVTAGTNTAALVMGTNGSLTVSGTGTINATNLNGTSLAGLATGILKNTTGTGVPSIAVAGDLPSGYAWSNLGVPAGNLLLAMGANTSIFTTTTAQSQHFAWKNTTPAVVGTSQGSPINALCGRAFHGSADVEDCMTLSELPGNGNDAAITFNVGHTGTSTGLVTTQFPGPVAAGANGTNAGAVQLPGNTTAPTPAANTFSWIGPPSASFTAYGAQIPTTAPSGNQVLQCGTPASSISTCTWVTGSGTPISTFTMYNTFTLGNLGFNPTSGTNYFLTDFVNQSNLSGATADSRAFFSSDSLVSGTIVSMTMNWNQQTDQVGTSIWTIKLCDFSVNLTCTAGGAIGTIGTINPIAANCASPAAHWCSVTSGAVSLTFTAGHVYGIQVTLDAGTTTTKSEVVVWNAILKLKPIA